MPRASIVASEAILGPCEMSDYATNGRLNNYYTSLQPIGRPQGRVVEMQLEMLEELLVSHRIFPKERDFSLSHFNQIYLWAWSRTFEDRFNEMHRRFPMVSKRRIRSELSTAWTQIEEVIVDATTPVQLLVAKHHP